MAIRPTNPGPHSRKLSNILYTAEKKIPQSRLITCESIWGQDRSFSLSIATLGSYCWKVRLKAIYGKKGLNNRYSGAGVLMLDPDHS